MQEATDATLATSEINESSDPKYLLQNLSTKTKQVGPAFKKQSETFSICCNSLHCLLTTHDCEFPGISTGTVFIKCIVLIVACRLSMHVVYMYVVTSYMNQTFKGLSTLPVWYAIHEHETVTND